MSHTDPVILALRALGETAGTAHDAEHAASCARCQAELIRLTEVVRLARNAEPGETLEAPPPQVWDRIAAAVGTRPALNGATPPALNGATPPALNGATPPAQAPATPVVLEAPVTSDNGRGSRLRRRPLPPWPRKRLASALAGLAAGLIIGIGGGIGVAQLGQTPSAHVVAQIELNPLPQFPQWQGTSGTAVMRATASQQEIAVTLRAPARPGFYEVWLLARNGVSMISLGDLSTGHTGTFTVPAGVDLRDYSRIDISLQPFDGDTQHSKTSVVRGSLPATALGPSTASRD
ncbi:MAG: anti-sigma factor [Streptosporangiaceae bacterium]